jgi:predicted nucleic acid-binding protein
MKTYNEKVSKYQELAEEIKRMCKQKKVNIVPLILSNTGIIPKHLFTSISSINLPRNTFIEIQKQAILSTCRLTRKVFDQK